MYVILIGSVHYNDSLTKPIDLGQLTLMNKQFAFYINM